MIPRVIHYCWFGRNPLPELAVQCIESWKKYCPGYEIREWNEDNYDLDSCKYVRQAYEAGKWAFVSDYARFDILFKYGGIYFDTDVELLKPIEPILNRGAFMGCESQRRKGKETARSGFGIAVNPGLGLAAASGNAIYKEMLDDYKELDFQKEYKDGSFKTVVDRITDVLERHGLIQTQETQCIKGISIYPDEFFCPLDYTTGILNITENTYSIHHYTASWIGRLDKVIVRLERMYCRKGKLATAVGDILILPLKAVNKVVKLGILDTMRFLGRKMLGLLRGKGNLCDM